MFTNLNSTIEYVGLFIGIIIATVIAASIFKHFFSKFIRRASIKMRTDPTNYKFLMHAISAMIYIVGIGLAIYMMPSLRTLAKSMLAGAGLLAVAVGFASQQALSNVVGGIFIIIFKPFRVNDRLKIRDTLTGIVEDISLRHVVIRDFENKRIIIPNSVISNEIIINSDFAEDTKICRFVDVGISYDSDLIKAKSIMREEVLNHPLAVDPRSPEMIEEGVEQVPVRVLLLGESSVNLRAWAWAINAPDAFVMGCDLLESIKLRFDREGIEIPFPHRTLVFKNKKDQESVVKETFPNHS